MVVYLFLHIELERRKAKLKLLGLRNGSKRNGNVERKEMWPRGKHTSGKERDVWNTVYLFYSINFLSKHWYCVEKLPSKIRYTIEMLLIPGNSGTHTQCFLELVYHYYKEIEVSSFCLFMCLFLCFFIIIVCLLVCILKKHFNPLAFASILAEYMQNEIWLYGLAQFWVSVNLLPWNVVLVY